MSAKPLVANILLNDVKNLIEETRIQIAITVNAEITMVYWKVGKRINQEVLQGKRAEYGKEIIKELAPNLMMHYSKGWGEKHLRNCIQFATIFPNEPIVYTQCKQFRWSHFRILLYVNDPLKREFHIEICKLEHWRVRQLQERIQSMLFERTAISKKPEETIKADLQKLREEKKLSPDLIFRNPYFFDFLGLSDKYLENGLESSISAELQRFMIEMENDFTFLAHQKRITIDNRDYYIDLLFFHRRLKCLIAIGLKIGAFEAGHKGNMELYLRYLEKMIVRKCTQYFVSLQHEIQHILR